MTAKQDLSAFGVEPRELDFVGQGLNRPECVLCTAAGDIFASHWTGAGVTQIRADGTRREILGNRDGPGLKVAPNGFAITADGDFLLANLHPEGGGAWHLSRTGALEPFLLEIDGKRLPPANYVGVDRAGRAWITVSTWMEPRHRAYRPDVADGFIILADRRGARIVADGLGYTNEAIVDGSGEWLYVNETFGRRTSRFPIAADGSLGRRETVTEYGPGTFPDGLAFDVEGAFWMTSVVSNRLVRVTPDGRQHVVLEENDPAALEVVERAFQAGELGRRHLDAIETKVMKSISSIAFGGPDLKTVYLGNLLDDRLYSFRSPIAGLAPPHWEIRM